MSRAFSYHKTPEQFRPDIYREHKGLFLNLNIKFYIGMEIIKFNIIAP